MESEFTGWLTATVFLPLAAALVIVLFVRRDDWVRYLAGAVAVAELGLSIYVFIRYYRDPVGLQLIDRFDWISIASFKVDYFLGVDGLSAPLVLLTGVLGMAAVYASWGITDRIREYFAWLLVLQTAVMGVFMAQDLFLFFVMWELELLPMFFLIAVWGSGRKEYSAMKFLIFTLGGSAFMLVGILVLFFSTGTFDMTLLPEKVQTSTLLMPIGWVFALLFIAFAIKLPVWPFHTWLPDAHTDAPTAASVMLAGVLLKMGGYGMIRIGVGMFPGVISDFAPWLIALGVVNVLYGAVVTVRQTDLKRLVAFSSISHMGYVLVGISSVAGAGGVVSSVGLTGASLQMFTHGTITGLMFLLVGIVYEKTGTRHIPDMGGLAGRMPIFAAAFLLAGLASLGLPTTSGFVSEILVFLGTFPVWSWPTALAVFGIVITAGYILWMVQRTMFGPRSERFADLDDATPLELVPVAVLVAAILVIGIYPAFVTDMFSNGVESMMEPLRQAAQATVR